MYSVFYQANLMKMTCIRQRGHEKQGCYVLKARLSVRAFFATLPAFIFFATFFEYTAISVRAAVEPFSDLIPKQILVFGTN